MMSPPLSGSWLFCIAAAAAALLAAICACFLASFNKASVSGLERPLQPFPDPSPLRASRVLLQLLRVRDVQGRNRLQIVRHLRILRGERAKGSIFCAASSAWWAAIFVSQSCRILSNEARACFDCVSASAASGAAGSTLNAPSASFSAATRLT